MKVYATLVLLLAVFMSASLYADSTSSSTTTENTASTSDPDTKNNEAAALTDADKKPADPELLKSEADAAELEPLVNDTETTEEDDSDEEDDEPDEDDC